MATWCARSSRPAGHRGGCGWASTCPPWDRHDPRYADPEAYDDLYLAQLRELCTHHGDLHELWFDGAGSAEREYAWDRIGGALIAELQPARRSSPWGGLRRSAGSATRTDWRQTLSAT